jgi:hypothetical protein
MVKVKFISLEKAKDGKHKYVVSLLNEETKKLHSIKFGALGMEDYTIHKNSKRKALYDARHSVREDWTDPLTAGFWSKWILWNKPTIDASLKDTLNKFKLV